MQGVGQGKCYPCNQRLTITQTLVIQVAKEQSLPYIKVRSLTPRGRVSINKYLMNFIQLQS